ncbi:unnamed protein product [Thelazia callipaeda]|uniref:Foie-gras_1 domain-containing protein n=1 Tax=Thelazia callipaeda TaxID=103827 RepID=A0A0N5D6Y5_THECL|nr:unnamed protein product [Thelazia callipaeda]
MDCEEIPPEVEANRQSQLVFITGLDIVNDKTHASVLSTLTSNRASDRPPLNFVMIDGTQIFNESAQHQPKVSQTKHGFIKKSWFKKYVTEVPAVVVLFADLNLNHPSWNEKVTECQSKISSLRTCIGKYATRVCIVLLQQSYPVDSPVAAEQTNKLCQSCQVSPKQLFIVPTDERMFASVVKLEIALHELAQAFYQHCLKSVRARPIANNSTNLIIRQQFKLGFLSELRQETHMALRHYKLAYQYCTQYEDFECDFSELRTVAGLLNYKICQLLFLHSLALEALSQQRRHVGAFFNCSPGLYPTLHLASIEHSLWKGKQCSLFANLFDRSVIDGLVTTSSQHPGMYLQIAAYFYRQANETIIEMKSLPRVCEPILSPWTPDSVVFYGQRPWKVGVMGDKNVGLSTAETVNTVRYDLEELCSPDYDRCIALLSAAMSQFKKHKCSRMQRFIMFLISEEYFSSEQYKKALQLISHIISECSREGFTQPIPVLLLRGLINAHRIADIKGYMTMSFQMLNLRTFPTCDFMTEKLMENILLIRLNNFPKPLVYNFNYEMKEKKKCEELWKSVYAERVFFSINAPRIDAFVRARVAFLSSTADIISSKSVIFLMVALSSYSKSEFYFEKLRVTVIDDSSKCEQQPMYEFTEDNIVVCPEKETVKIFKIPLSDSSFTVNKNLVVNGLSLEIGSIHSSVYGTLDWDAQSLSYGTCDNSYRISIMDACVGQTTIPIKSREVNFRLDHTEKNEALLGEIATLPLLFICEEDGSVENVKMEWYVDTKDDAENALVFVDEENQFISNGSKVLDHSSTQISPFQIGLKIPYCVQKLCTVNICIMISALVNSVKVQKLFLIPVRSRPPFEMSCSIFSSNNELINSPFTKTDLFIQIKITVISDMVVMDVSWEPSPELEVSESEKVLLEGLFLDPSDEVLYLQDEILALRAPFQFSFAEESKLCDLGELSIRWRRDGSMQSCVVSKLNIGSVLVKNSPLLVKTLFREAYLVVRVPVSVGFTISNLFTRTIDLQIILEPSDMFMFAGNKKVLLHKVFSYYLSAV